MSIRVTIWNEHLHDRTDEAVIKLYPKGLHGAIADLLKVSPDLEITTTTLDSDEYGLPDALLEKTDVLIWWGHMAHEQVPWELADKIMHRVWRGMGFIALHSAHMSRPFQRLMGDSCTLKWRDDAKEHLWCIAPGHPIAKGVPEVITFPREEMYGEPFGIPNPDEVIFTGWFSFGNVFRSGCTFHRGRGRIFYFQPGHETNPIYYNEHVGTILRNAVHWVAPNEISPEPSCPFEEHPLEGVK